jgi:TonB-dependent SusC/RagA subfamily outer membrane receptor
MDNHDTLFNQIKTAAENAESKEFPAMDKVWNRIEDKLDHQVLSTQNSLWKKIAVAASILLVVSIGYQFFKEEKQLITPQNSTATIDTTSISNDSVVDQNAVVASKETNPNIKENADAILNEQINGSQLVASDSISPKNTTVIPVITLDNEILPLTSSYLATPKTSDDKGWHVTKKYDARGVEYREIITYKTKDNSKHSEQDTIKTTRKDPPLIVMDNLNSNKQELSNLEEDEIESIILLKDPLYIINGVYYTEKEVFGPNPTSPYSPISEQQIETISILQDEKATSIYGEKGKKGVVIITTKDGKPAIKKGK